MNVQTGVRVLVVDDDAEIRAVVCDLLLAAGLNVAAAADYRGACVLLVSSDWDVLLSDFELADWQTGLDLAYEATERGVLPVIMSGCHEKRREVEACGLRFLAKPFSSAKLLAALGV